MAHGGKRNGSGRKRGSLTKRTQLIAQRAIEEGKTPLEIMLENMRHFQQVALDAEALIAGMTAKEITGENLKPDEQFKLLLAEVKKAAGFRVMAHECARDAASYMHPRLSTTTIEGNPDNPLEVVNIVERRITTENQVSDARPIDAEVVRTIN
jgi:hypothetical protein